MAQPQISPPVRDTPSTADSNGQLQQSLWRRMFGRDKDSNAPGSDAGSKRSGSEQQDDTKAGLIRRVSRKVVPGLPRAQTFKRQQSELRNKLEPVQPTPAERRAVSVDRRMHASHSASFSNPRTSAPDFLRRSFSSAPSVPSLPRSSVEEITLDAIGQLDGFEPEPDFEPQPEPEHSNNVDHIPDVVDALSITTSQYDTMIHEELERIWILNLSMHFRDKSKREKFFVTYREHSTLWRRVTVSLDYRDAPENSLEMELVQTKFQRDKSAKIYEAIRESLADIQFYDTVTNLKLQTTEGRLHVHVVEDVNEIVNYPTVRMIQHMRCRRVKEREIEFDSHMSGFVYKVRVNGEVLVKKEIPGPDTIDEFLYEINALNRLRTAQNVIQFYGVIVDDKEEYVKGLLISYADQGALLDVIFEKDHSLPWPTREKWARQIVAGLSEIHEAGFVQGDFTLSNIVIDDDGDAKIIDINRRGCPVGWEPPEASPLIESNQRISMYIGVKSDLFQLGMVLWALATQEDEPEAHGRPLLIAPDINVPSWYQRIVQICLSEDPRYRVQALRLLSLFPDFDEESQYDGHHTAPSISIDDNYSRHEDLTESFVGSAVPRIRTVQPPDWSYLGWSNPHLGTVAAEDPYYYPARGRSPPSPMPSNHGDYGSSRYGHHIRPSWSETQNKGMMALSVSDLTNSELDVDHRGEVKTNGVAPQTVGSIAEKPDAPLADSEARDGIQILSTEAIQPPQLAPERILPKGGSRQLNGERVQEGEKPTVLLERLAHVDTATQRRVESGQECDPVANNERLHPNAGGAGKPEPESPADSGKDVMDSTERRQRVPGGFRISSLELPNGFNHENTGEILDEGQYPAISLFGGNLREVAASDKPASEVRSDVTTRIAGPGSELPARQSSSSRSPARPATPPATFELPDDLKGIGSAYDFASEGGHDLIPEDDFGIDLDSSPTIAAIATPVADDSSGVVR
ncbi:hypothetical protein B0T24DRAFT_349419 [Lasiosphaeria ovina]|uniref:Protein kinase domain-containing protein n=1 Tax=Lasiosphaeria ovina TaxID=92902 RepID=A0AAE0N305_9PEZI|nr:hypothetical protein B0T24DRAFT_349419 [Lasiosphaeria ovina]